MILKLTQVARAAIGRPHRGGPASEPLVGGYRKSLPSRTKVALWLLLAGICFFYGASFATRAPAGVMPLVVPLPVLVLLLIWALPEGAAPPQQLLSPLLTAFFIALVLWPNYLAIALPGLPWITFLRLIGGPMVLVLLTCLSVSKAFRSELFRLLTADRPIAWAMIGLVIIQTYTLGLSRNPGDTLNRYLVAQVNFTAIFVVSVWCFRKPGAISFWIKLFLGMLFILCGLGIWEHRLQHVPWAGHIPPFLKVEDESVQRTLRGTARAATGIYRVQGTQTTPLGLAEILGLGIPFAIHVVVAGRSLAYRLVAAAFIPLSIYAILLTDSRLGVVAALAAAAFYFLLWAIRRWRVIQGSIIGPAIVLVYPALFCGLVASTFLVGKLRAKVWGNGAQDASTESRKEQWAMTWPKLFRNPLGYGVGEGGATLGFRSPSGILTIDSYYISVLLELGVVGFLIYYGLLLRAIWVASKVASTSRDHAETDLLMPLAVSLITFFIVKSVLSQDANHPLVFMMLGAVVALTYRAKTGSQTQF